MAEHVHPYIPDIPQSDKINHNIVVGTIFIIIVMLVMAILIPSKKTKTTVLKPSQPATAQSTTPGMVLTDKELRIDFYQCIPERRKLDFPFGSVTFNVRGKTGNTCIMDIGTEFINQNYRGEMQQTCKVPLSKGTVRFEKTQERISFEPVSFYCLENTQK